jgi:hypothetical protein
MFCRLLNKFYPKLRSLILQTLCEQEKKKWNNPANGRSHLPGYSGYA